MPYITKFVKAKLFMRVGDVSIYHTYKDDDVEQGMRQNFFVTDPEAGEDMAFDVRELPSWVKPPRPPILRGRDDTKENRRLWDKWCSENVYEKAVRKAIRLAVKNGEIKED